MSHGNSPVICSVHHQNFAQDSAASFVSSYSSLAYFGSVTKHGFKYIDQYKVMQLLKNKLILACRWAWQTLRKISELNWQLVHFSHERCHTGVLNAKYTDWTSVIWTQVIVHTEASVPRGILIQGQSISTWNWLNWIKPLSQFFLYKYLYLRLRLSMV